MAKDCYERTLSFVADASEMHSIYLRLASIYLQDGQVCYTGLEFTNTVSFFLKKKKKLPISFIYQTLYPRTCTDIVQ